VAVYKNAVYRLVTAAKLRMYHGTAAGPDGEILRSILKNGLLPDPKAKAYQAPYGNGENSDFSDLDFETETSMSLDESLGGAYLTTSVGEAVRYTKNAQTTHGGNKVLVAAQIETRSPEVRIDEDFLINFVWGFVLEGFDATNDDTFHLELFDWLEAKTDWETVGRAWLQKQFPGVKISEHQLHLVLKPLGDAIRHIMHVEFFRNHSRELRDEAEEQGRDDLEYIDEMEEISSSVAEYKSNIAEVSNLLTDVTTPNTKAMHNIRILRSVGYRGANRILAVVSWAEYPERIGTLHYYADLDAAHTIMKASGVRLWQDSQGQPIDL
jgi:hypothetical protein